MIRRTLFQTRFGNIAASQQHLAVRRKLYIVWHVQVFQTSAA